MLKNAISGIVVDAQIEAMRNGGFKVSDLTDYEAKVVELLEIVQAEKAKFNNLSDTDKLVSVMMERRVPLSAQVVDLSGSFKPSFDEKALTRKNTKKVAKQLLEIADGDFEKAMKIVDTMS